MREMSEAEMAHIVSELEKADSRKRGRDALDEMGLSTIPWTELKPMPSGAELGKEWNTYLRELPRLLAEGKEGQFVLIRGEAVAGLFACEVDAYDAGLERYADEEFLLQRVRSREPVLRMARAS